jgi:hypothetical protein
MEPYIQSCLEIFMNKMQQLASNGQAVHMANWTNALAFDVIGELGYGEAFGHMETESDVHNLRATILQGFKTFSIVGYFGVSGAGLSILYSAHSDHRHKLHSPITHTSAFVCDSPTRISADRIYCNTGCR